MEVSVFSGRCSKFPLTFDKVFCDSSEIPVFTDVPREKFFLGAYPNALHPFGGAAFRRFAVNMLKSMFHGLDFAPSAIFFREICIFFSSVTA